MSLIITGGEERRKNTEQIQEQSLKGTSTENRQHYKNKPWNQEVDTDDS